VAYCIGITNIDPIKYDLLFERFLNPDRKSMPDIDTDFDDEGRQKVIDYVVEKYGRNQVAQIVTYGGMAAKSSIRDVARVMDLPLPEADRLAKLVPERPGIELGRLLHAPFDGDGSLKNKENLSSDEVASVKQLREILDSGELTAMCCAKPKNWKVPCAAPACMPPASSSRLPTSRRSSRCAPARNPPCCSPSTTAR
jgi:DNA polymerase-3 subunit alpha